METEVNGWITVAVTTATPARGTHKTSKQSSIQLPKAPALLDLDLHEPSTVLGSFQFLYIYKKITNQSISRLT